jgi:predicted HicB family RNase H-like nuclease
MLRLNSDLHRRLAITAKQQHKSLNQLIADTLQQAVEHPQAS